MRQFIVLLVFLFGLVGFFPGPVATLEAKSFAGVHSALLALPVCHEDVGAEFEQAKADQLARIAASVDRHARVKDGALDRKLAAFVTAWGWHESAYSLRIGDGKCKPWECDGGRARGAYQGHRSIGMSDEDWDRMHGLVNIEFQVADAVHRARLHLGMCGGNVLQAYAALATGRGCSAKVRDKDGKHRVATFNLVYARL